MEKEKIRSMIKAIEKKSSELENYLSNLPSLSREDLLKEISKNIIQNSKLLHELLSDKDRLKLKEFKKEKSPLEHMIDGFISKIDANPSKKVIYLREFLELFQEISENDKKVILQSLKDEDVKEKLKERMSILTDTFQIKL